MFACKAKQVASTAHDNAKQAEAYYHERIYQADHYFMKKEYDQARNKYLEAHDIKPGEAYPLKQIELIKYQSEKENAEKQQERYAKLLQVADQNYQGKNYTKALDMYKRAQRINANDTLVMSRIKKCEKALKPSPEQE